MQREFREEAGCETSEGDWSHRVTLSGADFRVYFFCAIRPQAVDLRSGGEEPCEWVDTASLRDYPVIPNLHWLIPLCADGGVVGPVEVRDAGGGHFVNDNRPTVYVSAHYPDRSFPPVQLTVFSDPGGGYTARPARGGPPVAGGATVGQCVDSALAATAATREG